MVGSNLPVYVVGTVLKLLMSQILKTSDAETTSQMTDGVVLTSIWLGGGKTSRTVTVCRFGVRTD
jgi:hypothetical protein